MRKLLTAMLCAAMILSAGCGAPNVQPTPPVPSAQQPVASPQPTPSGEAKPLVQVYTGEPKPFPLITQQSVAGMLEAAKGANDFAFRLSAKTAQDNKNMVISPLSVFIALSALGNATNDEATAALMTSLGLEGHDANSVNEAVAGILNTLTNGEDESNPLAIANAIFVNQDMALRQEFAKDFSDYYRGTAFQADFSSQQALTDINAWAAEHTNGLIDKILPSLPETTAAVLTNAIYFSSRWSTEFEEANTKEATFHGANGDTTVPFMHKEQAGYSYYEDDTLQCIRMPFVTGQSMYILLPRDGDADALLAGMTGERFLGITANAQYRQGNLSLPRFEINSEYTLRETLMALGVPLFEGAPLTNLIENDALYVSDCLHRATIKLDEKGTTAAAVTAIMMATGALMPEDTFEMVCDKPFVFMLCADMPEGVAQVLFTGLVNEL